MTVRRLSDNTVRAYRNDLAQFRLTLADSGWPEPNAIRAALTSIVSDKKLSAATIRRRIASIRGFLRFTDPEIALRVFSSWTLEIKLPLRLPRSISVYELETLLRASDGRRTDASELCILLLAATGLRVSELCSLGPNDVDQQTGEIRVVGKGSRERIVVVVDATLRRMLEKHIRSIPDANASGAPLLRNRRGRPMTPQCVRQRLRRLSISSKMKSRVTPHMLRHTAATMLIEGGVDIRFVQRLLGHASIATTQLYTHVSDTALRTALLRANVMEKFHVQQGRPSTTREPSERSL